MSRPLVTFGDSEALAIALLKAAFLERDEAYKPPQNAINTLFPSVALVNATHIQVELELAGSDDHPIGERDQVRFTCYAPPKRRAGDTVGGRSDVKALAKLTKGLVYAHSAGGGVNGTKILIGPSDVVTDPDTGNLGVWFLARLTLAPELLVS